MTLVVPRRAKALKLVAMAVTDRKSLRPWVTGFAGCFADTAALD
jgi:hypothetical protein